MSIRRLMRNRARATSGGGGGGSAPVVSDIAAAPSTGLTTTTPVSLSYTASGSPTSQSWVFKINGAQVGSSSLLAPSFTFPSAGTARAEVTATNVNGTSAVYGEDIGTVTPSAAFLAMGYNIHAQDYFEKFGKWINMARASALLGGNSTLDTDGWPLIPASGTAQLHVIREIDEYASGIDGAYVLTWTGPATASIGGGYTTVTNTAANRIEFTLNTSAAFADLDADYQRSALSGLAITVTFSNGTGAVTKPQFVFMKAAHEALHNQGKRFTPEFIARIKTNSGDTASRGMIRFMQAMNEIGGWCQTTAEIARDGGIGGNGFVAQAFDMGGGIYGTEKGSPATMFSPEDCAALCVEAERGAWLTPWAMVQNTAWDAWLTRFKAGYPVGRKIRLEPGNETWIHGMRDTAYFRYNYTAAFGTASMNDSTVFDQQRNAGDHGFRMWRVTVDNIGEANVIRVGAYQAALNDGWNDLKLDRTDTYQRWSANTALRYGDVATEMTQGGYISVGMSWPQVDENVGDLWALLKNRAWEDNAFTGGSASTYWNNRFMNAAGGITAYNAMLTSQNAHIASKNYLGGCTKIQSIYEGGDHDNPTPFRDWGVGAAHLAMQSDGTKLIPANLDIKPYYYNPAGTPTMMENHAGESAAAWFTDGQRAQIYYTDNTGLLRRGWLVKVVSGGIQLFANRAAYVANTPTSVPNGTVAFVVNESRLTTLVEYVHDRLMADITLYTVHWDNLRAQGVIEYQHYAYDHIVTIYRSAISAGLSVDYKPWGINRGATYGTASAAGNYIVSRAA